MTLAEPLSFQNGFSAQEFIVTILQRRGRRQTVFRDVATGILCRFSADHLAGAAFS